MTFYRELRSDEIFEPGDLEIKSPNICMSCDGDRCTFSQVSRTLYLREVDSEKTAFGFFLKRAAGL